MRLDQYLFDNGYAESRNKAKYEIEQGNVKVNGKIITKASFDLKEEDIVEHIKENELRYVSKGGLKLEKALAEFNVSPNGLVCADIGSSTGGFTDCLLQNGAKEVYSIDTGTNQLHESLRNKVEIHSMENTNFLTMGLSPLEKVSFFVIDVSFIKVEPILERIIDNFKDATIVSLVKPQFELGHIHLKNGVVKDAKLHKQVLEQIELFLKSKGIKSHYLTESPILGGSGNKEFLIKFNI